MAAIKSFRDLEVYKLGLEEARKIFLLTKSFSTQERYALTDQIRRSSRAVNAMIAEGWARRRYPASFVNKINEALGEAMETQRGSIMHWVAATSAMTSTVSLTEVGSTSAQCSIA